MELAEPIKTVVVLDSGVGSSDVARALPGGSGIEIAGMIDGLEEARMRLVETSADLVVIFARSQSESVLDLIEYSVRATPGRPVVVLGHAIGAGFTKRAFAAGADDLIVLPAQAENVVFALQKAMARKVTGGDVVGSDRAPLICVLGPKGGTGKTLVSTSLAVALAQAGKRVAVVDLDLQFGDVGLTLAVAPEKTIYDLVKAGGSLDAEKLDDFLVVHQSGVKLLLAPSRPDHAAVVTVDVLREIFTVLRQMVDFVIVDTPPGFTPEVIATIDAATSIVIVSMLDALSLKNTKLGLETLELMGFPSAHVKFVLNRARSRVGITEGEVVHVVGRVPDVMIPSDRDITRAINEGTPIVITKPQSEAAQAFRALARSFLGDTASAPVEIKRKSLFSRRNEDDLFTEPTVPAKRQSLFARKPTPLATVESVIANGDGDEPTSSADTLVTHPPTVPVRDTYNGQPTPEVGEHLEGESSVANAPASPPVEVAARPRRPRQSLITKARGARTAEKTAGSGRKRESLVLKYLASRAPENEPAAVAVTETVAPPATAPRTPLVAIEPDDKGYPSSPLPSAGLNEYEIWDPEPAVASAPGSDVYLVPRSSSLDGDDSSHRYANGHSPAWLPSEERETAVLPASASVGTSALRPIAPSQPESVWPVSEAGANRSGSHAPQPAEAPLVPGFDAFGNRYTAPQRDSTSSNRDAAQRWTTLGDSSDASAGARSWRSEFELPGHDDADGAEQLHVPLQLHPRDD